MREVLQRLFKQAEPIRRFCIVQTLLPDGRYTVTDDQDRQLTVDGETGYLPGNRVVVQAWRIVGLGRRSSIGKTYRM